jgi:alcohol dehydrogenase/propanol-preferring alcohol dehydrogenase
MLHIIQDARGDGVSQRLTELCGGPLMAVVDLVNGSATARFAFDALGKGGKLVQVGLFGGELSLPLPLMAMRAITIQGSYVGSLNEIAELLDLVNRKGAPDVPVATRPLDQVNAALNDLRAGKIIGRVVVTP